MDESKKTSAYAAWIAICIIWGTTYLAIRVGVKDLPPMLFAGFRWIIAGPLLMSVLLLKGYKLPRINELKHMFIIGVTLLGITNGLVVVAEKWIPSGLTALLISTLPFWVVLIEWIISGFRGVNIKIISGIILGFAGVAIIFIDDIQYLLEPEYLLGIISIMIAMISWAGGSLYSKRITLSSRPLMSASVQMIFAGLAQTIVGLSIGELDSFSFTPDSLIAYLYLLIIASVLGYGSYIYAISHLPVSFVTTYAYINPVIALFLGWIILDEKLSILIGVSAVIILTGVWLVQKGTRSEQK